MQKIPSKTDKSAQNLEKQQENFMKQMENREIILQKQQETFLKIMKQFTKHLNLNSGQSENFIFILFPYNFFFTNQ